MFSSWYPLKKIGRYRHFSVCGSIIKTAGQFTHFPCETHVKTLISITLGLPAHNARFAPPSLCFNIFWLSENYEKINICGCSLDHWYQFPFFKISISITVRVVGQKSRRVFFLRINVFENSALNIAKNEAFENENHFFFSINQKFSS